MKLCSLPDDVWELVDKVTRWRIPDQAELSAIQDGIKAKSRKVTFGTGALQDDLQRAKARNAKRLKSLPGARGTRGAGTGTPSPPEAQKRSQEAKTKFPEASGRSNKYRNVPTVVDNIRFASKAEAKRYGELKLLEKAGLIIDLKCQPRYVLMVNGHRVGAYVADFSYRRFDESKPVVEDVKSEPTKTAVYRIKKALMLALWDVEIRES